MEKPIIVEHMEKAPIAHNSVEKHYWNSNLWVCGIDEAGRGPFAGPVVAAAVMIPQNCSSPLLKDSKLLSEKNLQKAYTWILKQCWIGVGIESHTAIDTHNIYQATLRAMRRALCQLHSTAPQKVSGIIVDAMPLTFEANLFRTIPVHSFIYAESLSSSVAAASIVAKVTRDRLMRTLDPIIPSYEFAQHKGYGTAQHQKLIHLHGRSLVHRNSFLRKLENKKVLNDSKKQATIWGSYSEHP